MWILFMLLITSPGQFQAEVLYTYETPTAQESCEKMKEKLYKEFAIAYPSAIDKDTYGFICLKQKEKEA